MGEEEIEEEEEEEEENEEEEEEDESDFDSDKACKLLKEMVEKHPDASETDIEQYLQGEGVPSEQLEKVQQDCDLHGDNEQEDHENDEEEEEHEPHEQEDNYKLVGSSIYCLLEEPEVPEEPGVPEEPEVPTPDRCHLVACGLAICRPGQKRVPPNPSVGRCCEGCSGTPIAPIEEPVMDCRSVRCVRPICRLGQKRVPPNPSVGDCCGGCSGTPTGRPVIVPKRL